MSNQKLADMLRQFDALGADYDYTSAIGAGMGPQKEGGENKGHWGSVVPTPIQYRMDYKLPEDSYMMLKGASHPTFQKGVQGELERGYQVIKIGDRYFSVPADFAKETK
jgi:hypothetical protein